VALAVGDAVQASSTTSVITVIGTNGYVVDLTVPLASVDVVKVGQTAAVTVPSSGQTLTGTVSSIGVLDVSSTATPEYDVVVALDPSSEPLFDGSSAQVVVTVAGTGDVLTVPTSAVHVDGSKVTVQVLADGAVTDVAVERGAVGTELTEITSGLTAGQVVVLADRNQVMKSSSSTSKSSSGLLSGTTQQGRGAGQFGSGFGGPPGG